MVELRCVVKHKVGESYNITELKVEGVETVDGIVFRTSVQLSVNLTKEVDWEKVVKEVEFVKSVLREKAENFRSNAERLRKMLSVFGKVEEEVVYI